MVAGADCVRGGAAGARVGLPTDPSVGGGMPPGVGVDEFAGIVAFTLGGRIPLGGVVCIDGIDADVETGQPVPFGGSKVGVDGTAGTRGVVVIGLLVPFHTTIVTSWVVVDLFSVPPTGPAVDGVVGVGAGIGLAVPFDTTTDGTVDTYSVDVIGLLVHTTIVTSWVVVDLCSITPPDPAVDGVVGIGAGTGSAVPFDTTTDGTVDTYSVVVIGMLVPLGAMVIFGVVIHMVAFTSFVAATSGDVDTADTEIGGTVPIDTDTGACPVVEMYPLVPFHTATDGVDGECRVVEGLLVPFD